MAISTGVVSSSLSVLLYNADGSFRSPIFLATIELAAFGGGSAETLHLSSPGYVGPDDQLWDDVLDVGQINAGGSWLTSRWNPADLDLTVYDKRLNGQAVGETFHDLFTDYEFVGALVHLQVAFENTTSTSDYATIFHGRIESWRDMNASSVTFYCQQDRRWSVPIPPNKVTKTDFPHAPSDVIGVPRPIDFGDHASRAAQVPVLSSGYETLQAGVARGLYPSVMVELESGVGGLTSPKVLLSDKDLHTDPERLCFYERALEQWAFSITAPTMTGTGPVYAQLPSYQFYVPVLPIENQTGGVTTAVDWQECIRKDKPYTLEGKTSFDYDASERVLELLMPDVPELGTFVGAQVFLWYNKNASGASHPRFGSKNTITGDTLQDLAAAATSSTSSSVPTGFTAVNVGPAATGGTDRITEWSHIKNTRLFAEVRAATQTLEVHRILLLVLYKPQARVVNPGVLRTDLDVSKFPRAGRSGFRTRMNPFSYGASTPEVSAYDNALYGYRKGIYDSSHSSGAANGTYTGSAGTLIEHPVDLAHWVLRELGGEGSSEITTTAGAFGSFADARTTLASYKVLGQIDREQPIEEFLEGLGRQVLCWFHRRTTLPLSPWVAIPWATGASQDYRESSDLVNFLAAGSFVVRNSLRIGRTPEDQVANTVRVNYDYDPRSRTYGDQLYVSPSGSRVYSGGAFTTDAARVTLATTSQTLYGKGEVTLDLKNVRDPATASSILTRMFDWRYFPRIVTKFNTFLNAIDLERGHVLRLGSDWDDYLAYPKAGGNGSWQSKNLQVFSVTKLKELPVQYAVTAIET